MLTSKFSTSSRLSVREGSLASVVYIRMDRWLIDVPSQSANRKVCFPRQKCQHSSNHEFSMLYRFQNCNYLLNLIDTPVSDMFLPFCEFYSNYFRKGHVDFAWEVSRSLAACQGVLLLVDASQGVQAQTMSVFHNAKEKGLKIIPVLNKVKPKYFNQSHFSSTLHQIDLPAARPDQVAAQIESTFGIDPADFLHVSAKTGLGTEKVLTEIVQRIPPPKANSDESLSAFLFDSSSAHILDSRYCMNLF